MARTSKKRLSKHKKARTSSKATLADIFTLKKIPFVLLLSIVLVALLVNVLPGDGALVGAAYTTYNDLSIGDYLVQPDGYFYEVTKIEDDDVFISSYNSDGSRASENIKVPDPTVNYKEGSSVYTNFDAAKSQAKINAEEYASSTQTAAEILADDSTEVDASTPLADEDEFEDFEFGSAIDGIVVHESSYKYESDVEDVTDIYITSDQVGVSLENQELVVDGTTYDNVYYIQQEDGSWESDLGTAADAATTKKLNEATSTLEANEHYATITNADGTVTFVDRSAKEDQDELTYNRISEEFVVDMQITDETEIEIESTGGAIVVTAGDSKITYEEQTPTTGFTYLDTTFEYTNADGTKTTDGARLYLLEDGTKIKSDLDGNINDYEGYSGNYGGTGPVELSKGKEGDKQDKLKITSTTKDADKSSTTEYEYSKGSTTTRTDTNYRSSTVDTYSRTNHNGDKTTSSGTITDLDSDKTYYYDVPEEGGAYVLNEKGELVGVKTGVEAGDTITTSPEDGGSDMYYVTEDGKTVGKLRTGADINDGIQESDLSSTTDPDCSTDPQVCTLQTQKSLQTTFSTLSTAVGEIGSTQFFSSMLGADDAVARVLGFDDIEAWDRWFSGTILAEGYFESLICASKYPDIQSSDGVFVDNGHGFQSVGSVNGEISYRTSPQPILCYPNEEGDYACPVTAYECSTEGYCIDDNEDIIEGYLYKFSWGIRAPSDKSLTPYSDESSPGYVSYNIVAYKTDLSNQNDVNSITGTLDTNCADTMSSLESDLAGGNPNCIPLYVDGSANTKNPLVLLGGEGDGQTVMVWSTKNNYESICIHWSDAPYTQAYGLFGEGANFLSGVIPGDGSYPTKQEMATNGKGNYLAPSYCSKVIDLELGTVGLENFEDLDDRYTTTSSASNTAGSESVTTADVGTTVGQVSFP